MTSAKLRLALSATAFVGWIGFLAYLAFSNRHTPVLARPQFQASNLVLIAQVDGPEAVRVEEVIWPASEAGRVGQPLRVPGISRSEGYGDPGPYILPLTVHDQDLQITPMPRSPGYEPPFQGVAPRIYPVTPEARRQLEQMPRP